MRGLDIFASDFEHYGRCPCSWRCNPARSQKGKIISGSALFP